MTGEDIRVNLEYAEREMTERIERRAKDLANNLGWESWDGLLRPTPTEALVIAVASGFLGIIHKLDKIESHLS